MLTASTLQEVIASNRRRLIARDHEILGMVPGTRLNRDEQKLLAPERLRQLPSQFSWIDRQLVRGGHLRDCDHSAWALSLFLATVSDSQGPSYYSDASVLPVAPR